MSHFGSDGFRSRDVSIVRMASLDSETPFLYTVRLSSTTGLMPFHVMVFAHSSMVLVSTSLVPFQCCSNIPQQRSMGLYLLW